MEVSQASPDLGWLPQANLAPWMQDAAGSLQPGQVSGVIELPVGCAVLQLVERRKIEPLTYEQAKPQLSALLMEQAFQEEYVRFVERLRKQTYVERKGVFSDATRLRRRESAADDPVTSPVRRSRRRPAPRSTCAARASTICAASTCAFRATSSS